MARDAQKDMLAELLAEEEAAAVTEPPAPPARAEAPAPPPPPRPKKAKAEKGPSGKGVFAQVLARVPKASSEGRTTSVYFPGRLLKRLDQAVKDGGYKSRSAFIVAVVEAFLDAGGW